MIVKRFWVRRGETTIRTIGALRMAFMFSVVLLCDARAVSLKLAVGVENTGIQVTEFPARPVSQRNVRFDKLITQVWTTKHSGARGHHENRNGSTD